MAREVRAPLAGALACAVALALLAALTYGSHAVQVLDARTLARFVLSGGGAEDVASAIRTLGNLPETLAMLLVACGIAIGRARPRSAVAALAVVAGASLTTQLLKLLFAHPRVRAVLGADQFAWDGFPSGHVTAATSIAIAFAFVAPAGWARLAVAIAGAGFVLAMSWAVLALEVHYPSDVLGGVLVGGAWGLATLAALRLWEGGYREAPQSPRRAAISVK